MNLVYPQMRKILWKIKPKILLKILVHEMAYADGTRTPDNVIDEFLLLVKTRFVDNVVASPSRMDSNVGGADGVTGGAQVLNSELRNAVWDAFGLVNFVWW